jgi:aryl-alcohol dehydrogenase (NADP+)
MQGQLNLIQREDEHEMLPLCIEEGIGCIPWSPIARGRLARPWGEATHRTETDVYGRTLYARTEEANRAINGVVAEIAKERGVKMAQVALAWVLHKQPVTAPIVGVTRLEQLADAVAAVEVKLSAEDVSRLEAPYVPTGRGSFN